MNSENFRKLKARRALLGLVNAQIAEMAGCHEDTVSRFLNGRNVRPATAEAICAALGMARVINFAPAAPDREFEDVISGFGPALKAVSAATLEQWPPIN